MRLDPAKTSVLLIDPQVGFCSPAGTLAKIHGEADIEPITRSMVRAGAFLKGLPGSVAVILVTSRYPPGLHTGGDLTHPLAYLCVPGASRDCELVESIHIRPDWITVEKTSTDVMRSESFISVAEMLFDAGRQAVVICGATLTTCIQDAVLGLSRHREAIRIILPLDGIGVRLSARQSSHELASREKRALERITQAGAILTATDQIEWA